MKQVIVNREDLQGDMFNMTDCPLVRALKRALPKDTTVIVTFWQIIIDDVRTEVNADIIGLDNLEKIIERVKINGSATVRFGVDILN